ncbi:MAG TPA: hypothetical protein VF171_03680 [Trueperaceae bacterium]
MSLRHHTYVLRVWLEPDADISGWRASLSDISTPDPADRRYFSDIDTLVRFLKDELGLLPPHEEGRKRQPGRP